MDVITLCDELRSQIRIHSDGIPAHKLLALLMSSAHGPWEQSDIIAALAHARADNFANVGKDGRWHQTKFSIAQERYELLRMIEPTWQDRAGALLATLWHKCWGGICLVIATSFFALGLCAQEVPDRVIAALVQVESGCEWRAIGDIKGTWSRGADGEVSAFQISPAALTDMGVTNHARVHRDSVYAESLARLWLSRCFAKCGNWPQALAIYNAGSRYRSRSARDYSARILNLASTIN